MVNTHLFVFAILTFIVASWISITYISHVSGWASLVEPYRSTDPFSGSQWKFESAQMRYLTRYNHCLIVGADPRGLYLSVMWPLRIAHPPLFIPWREISRSAKKILWIEYIELRLGLESPVPFRIRSGLAQKLKTASGTSWPLEAIA